MLLELNLNKKCFFERKINKNRTTPNFKAILTISPKIVIIPIEWRFCRTESHKAKGWKWPKNFYEFRAADRILYDIVFIIRP